MPCRAENHDDGHKYKTKKQVKYQRRFVLYRFHVAKIGLSHSFRKDNAQRSFTNILSLFTLSPFIPFKIRIFADIRDHEQRYEALIIISAILVFVLFSCADRHQEAEQKQSLMEISKQELADALAERDQLLGIVKEITVSMEKIKHIENIMAAPCRSAGDRPQQRDRILSDMAAVQQSLRARRIQLNSLERQLQESSLYSEELQSIIEALRGQIDSQIKDITAMHKHIASANATIDLEQQGRLLNSTVADVNEILDASHEESARLENELNTCYYIVATRSELKKHQILETGFLRRTRLLNADFDRKFFSTDDKGLCTPYICRPERQKSIHPTPMTHMS